MLGTAPGLSHIRASRIVKTITSRHNPIITRCRELAARRSGDETLVLLDGPHLVREALDAGVPIDSLLASRRALESSEGAALVRAAGAAGVALWAVTDDVLRSVKVSTSPTGIVAIARYRSVPLDEALAPAPQLVMIAVDLQDPGNAGALVRAAEASGATGVIFCGRSTDPFGWKALRGSMGSAFRLPVVARAGFAAVIGLARERRLTVLGLVPRGGRDLFEQDLTRPLVVLLGGEGPGLAADELGRADDAVSIPMAAPVESLNVAVAAAIVGYEAYRQRRAAAPARPRTGGLAAGRHREGDTHGAR